MCGIAGYVGSRPSSLELYSALQRLEYRGYDSAGLVIGGDGADLQVHRCRGSVAGLSDSSRDLGKPAGIQFGLAHTRWATHGEPSERNAHPHLDCGGRLAVVHNGIIANHRQLRAELEAAGHTFRSETDSEVLAHLVEDVYEDDLVAAVRAALERVEGSYALGVLHQERAELVAARRGGPLVVGCAEGEAFLASDVTAFIDRTHEVVFLEDGDIARLDEHSIEVFDLRGNQRSWTPVEVPWRVEDTSRGGFRHFMRKEIDEQPQVLEACLNGRCGDVVEVPEVRDLLADGVPGEILITACGTSFHAGSIAADYLERLAGIPTRVLLGSEYSNWVRAEPAGRWLLALSQSGETADTLAAVRGFRASGGRVLAICNTLGSSLVREADATVLTQAGPEIGVASTKA
ncbi:MAG: glutamine--fructose-6-phosphate transaminase (isomerizing), partial [Acidobacteriota bacterium]